MTERRTISDRLEWLEWRRVNVNASESAALFGDGVHPYRTAYQLWAIKSGLRQEEPDTPTKRRGRLFEPALVQLVQEERPTWQIQRPNEYLFDPDSKIGATPDLYAISALGFGVVQLKTVGPSAFRRHWRDADTGEIDVPLWIAIQASVEAHLAGADWAAVAAMTTLGYGGVDFVLQDVRLRPGLIVNLKQRVADFWRRVEQRDPYPVDWSRDRDAVLALHQAHNGSEVDLRGDEAFAQLMAVREAAKLIERLADDAHERRKDAEAQIIMRMGNASVARFDGGVLTRRTVNCKERIVKAYSYPLLRTRADAA